MKQRRPWTSWAYVALCGSVLLAGCPGSGTAGGGFTSGGTTGGGITGIMGATSSACTVPVNEDTLVAQVLSRVNTERANVGLNTLTVNPVLTKMAEDYCCEMIEGGFFAHDNPLNGEGPGERAIQAGYVFLAVGENLAAGQQTAKEAMDAWMASLGHKENILGIQWQEMGIGVRTGGQYGIYWVQVFGRPP